MLSCRDVEPQLSLLVDGALPAEDRGRVRAHVRDCPACQGLLSDLEQIRGVAGQLGPITPPQHVWLETAGQIRLTQSPAPPPATTARGPALQWISLAAALVLVTIGIFLVQRSPVGDAPEPAPATAAGSVEAVAEELNLAAAHYEKAIAELEALARSSDEPMDTAVAAVVQRNLGAIDSAIAESRAALVSNPDSQPARDSLFEALRRKISILQTTVSLINEMRLGDQEGARRAADNLGKKS
jgi:anti-sigma factor RsiW